MQKQYALSIDHVSKILGGQKRINDMSIHCEYGHIYGLIGPNGSGKTTLLKLITGLYQPDSVLPQESPQTVWSSSAGYCDLS